MTSTVCDVILENPAYGGTSTAFLDQPFLYYSHSLILFKQFRQRNSCCLQMLFILCEKSTCSDNIVSNNRLGRIQAGNAAQNIQPPLNQSTLTHIQKHTCHQSCINSLPIHVRNT